MCSFGHLHGVNSLSARVFALPEDKIFFRAKVSNSDTPYHQREESSWKFSGITDATIDTGTIVKLGWRLAGVCRACFG